MTFASAPRVPRAPRGADQTVRPQVVILECSAIPDIEYTALRILTRAEEKMQEGGISLWLSALNPLALEMIRRSPLGRTLGSERMFFNICDAVNAYETRGKSPLDKRLWCTEWRCRSIEPMGPSIGISKPSKTICFVTTAEGSGCTQLHVVRPKQHAMDDEAADEPGKEHDDPGDDEFPIHAPPRLYIPLRSKHTPARGGATPGA